MWYNHAETIKRYNYFIGEIKMQISVKRIFSILLCAIMLASFSACGADGGSPDVTSAPAAQTTADTAGDETQIKAELPDVNYDGYNFRVLIQGEEKHDQEIDMFYYEDYAGDVINDDVFKRNSLVEETYGIKLSVMQMEYTKLSSAVSKSVTAGSDDYDLAFSQMNEGVTQAASGILLPINELSYVDLTKPWWDAGVGESFSISGNVLAVCGSISPYSFMTTSAMLFNKNLFDSYDMEYPYQTVLDGAWTLDSFCSLLKDRNIDVDGNGVIDEKSDVYGYTAFILDAPYDFFYGSGNTVVKNDSDGIPQLAIDTERAVSTTEKVYDIFYTYNSFLSSEPNITGNDLPLTMFSEGRSFITGIGLTDLYQYFRSMEDDFGIIPVPKLDENQAEYMSFVNGCSNIVVVPKTVADTERTGIILEALAYNAYNIITPDVYEVVLKVKNTRDNDSEAMIDIILKNRVFDLGYSVGVPNVGMFLKTMLEKKTTDVVSYLDKNMPAAEKSLQKIVDTYTESLG